MLERTFTGKPPVLPVPAGAVDTQIHAYVDGYPAIEGGPGLPAGALPKPEHYRQVMDWLGVERVVVTQGNAHQADNSCLLEAIAELGDVAKGVAVCTPDVTEAEIDRLSRAGIVGTRIMDLNGGAVGLEHLEAMDAIAADAGWVMAVQFDGSALPELEPRLAKLRSRWILDHHAKIFDGATPAHVDTIRRLLDGGRMWFKFAACYESTRTGGPHYDDIAAVARSVVDHAPQRVLWGTNWPHNMIRETADYPNDAELLDLAMQWMGTPENRQLALVDNPTELFGFE